MHIDWGSLGLVFGAALLAVVAVAVLFGLGVLGWSRYEAAKAQGTGGAAFQIGAGAAFVACALVALFGVYLIALN